MSNSKEINKIFLMHYSPVNTGAVAMAESAIQMIQSKFPSSEIIIESDHPDWTKKMFPDVTVVRRAFTIAGLKYTKKILSIEFAVKNFGFLVRVSLVFLTSFLAGLLKIRYSPFEGIRPMIESDLVLSLAGDSISEDYAYTLRFYEFWLIKRFNTPNILLSQSVGPFNGTARKQAKFGLNLVTAIITRDQKTNELMKEYGIKVPIYSALDLAIALKPAMVDEDIKKEIKNNELDKKKVGVVIRINKFTGYSQQDYENYLSGMDKIIKLIKSRGLEIIFVSTIIEDTNAIKNFKEKFSNTENIIELYNYKPSQAKVILGNLFFIISPRMHPIILSSTSGQNVPVIGLGREFKMKEYLEICGLSQNFTPMIPFDLEKTLEIVENVIKNNKQQREILAKNMPGMIKTSNSSMDIVKEKVLKNS